MAANREYRPRSRRSGSEVDAVAVALAVQIILCVLLLIAAGISKGINEERHGLFRREFADLVGNDAGGQQLAAYLQELEEIGQSFFTSVENLLRRLLWSPEPPEEASPIPSQPERPDFGYQYLEPQGVSAGLIPLRAGSEPERQMQAPAGNTLAPVYLAGSIRPPVAGVITSPFAYRIHPLEGNLDFHNGIDVAAEEGRSILAALPGEVAETGFSPVYGNYIRLRHASNLSTFYAHCSQIIAREGMAVRQGERIARVGQTGAATGPHLHFSVIAEGQFADPYWVLGEYLELVD